MAAFFWPDLEGRRDAANYKFTELKPLTRLQSVQEGVRGPRQRFRYSLCGVWVSRLIKLLRVSRSDTDVKGS